MAKVPGWMRRIFGRAKQAAVVAVAEEVVNGAAKAGVSVEVEGMGGTVIKCPRCGEMIEIK